MVRALKDYQGSLTASADANIPARWVTPSSHKASSPQNSQISEVLREAGDSGSSLDIATLRKLGSEGQLLSPTGFLRDPFINS